ncbi:MAG: hypothetical protein H6922_01545 [Pseudomonadaceae bacterium]|nr:hypothetical protein [Pseudomonadaceae bacterium]
MDVRISSYRPLPVSANPAPRSATTLGAPTAPQAAQAPTPQAQAARNVVNLPNNLQQIAEASPMGPRGSLVDIMV